MTKKKICPECLSLIGVGARMKIIRYLRRMTGGKMSNKNRKIAKEIGRHFSLTQPTISHHLKVLKEIGMVGSKKQGREIHYFLNKKYPCKKCHLFKIPFKLQ